MLAPASPLDTSPFTLCTSGVAGLVGGDEAVLALAAVHVYESRRWLGWYNSPGSYQIAKRLDLLAKSRAFNCVSPGVHADPTSLLDLNINKGPKFRAAYSGTVIEDTGSVASLVMEECALLEGKVVGQERKAEVVGVTIVKLSREPLPRIYPRWINPYTPIFAGIPIAVSLSCCVQCFVFGDWWAFSLILLGILANGISSLVIGSGKLQFTHPDPARGSPHGDGILVAGREIVLLMGAEGAVNSITRGHFSLQFSDEAEFGRIEWCSVLFTVQFIAQLLLIPQASLFGQILFVISLGVSWVYNSCLTSLHKDKIQRAILFNNVLEEHALIKYTFGMFSSAIVFALLVLRPEEPIKFLDELLPDTSVWTQWKQEIVRQLFDREEPPKFTVANIKVDGCTDDDKLLEKLYSDAEAAYSVYVKDFCCNHH